MSDNLDLWNKVEKTNPEYTKNANVKGNQITSIAPQYQIKQATEKFGVYGQAWGISGSWFDYTLKDLGMIVFHATFFYPEGEFPIVNSVQLFKDNAQTKIDDDFAKKVETDTLTKALSKLGFNADIFLGKFEDARYLQELNEEFNKPKPTPDQIATFKMYMENEDALRFYLFSKSIGEEIYTALYNSAPKDKMKFKKKCEELEKAGLDIASSIVVDATLLINNDDPAWSEELEGLEKGEKEVLAGMFNKETLEKMRKMK